MNKPKCNCQSCRFRREAQNRWIAKNRAKKNATNKKSVLKARAAARAEGNSPEVSDEELDRRALGMMEREL